MLMLKTVNENPFTVCRILHAIGRKAVEHVLDIKTFVIELVRPFKNRFNKTETKIKSCSIESEFEKVHSLAV
jgi:hypothetical protein